MGDFSIGGFIEVSLRQLNEARQTIRDVGDEMQATFDRIASDAESALDVFGGLGAFSAGSLAVFSEVDDAIKTIEASTQSLENVTFDVGNTFNDVYLRAGQEGAEAVADAIKLSAQSLELISDTASVAAGDVEFVSEAALGLSNTFENLDADQAILAITNLMDNFGISSQEASDLLSTAMSGSLGSADDLADTLIEYPRYFKDLELGADEFFSILESGADAFGTDVVADLLKEFNIISQEVTDGYVQAFGDIFSESPTGLIDAVDEFGLSLDGILVPQDVTEWLDSVESGAEGAGVAVRQITEADLEDPFFAGHAAFQIFQKGLDDGSITDGNVFNELLSGLSEMEDDIFRNATAVELFGTKAEDLTGFEEVLSTTSDSFKDVEGSLESVVSAGISVQDEFDTLRRALTLTLSDIGQSIAEAIDLSAIVDTLTGVLQTVRDGFNSLPSSVQAAIGTFLGFSSAIAALAPVMGVIGAALSAFNPVVIAIVGSVALLSAAFVAFKDILPLIDFSGFSAAFEGLQAAFGPLMQTIGELGGAFLGAIDDALGISEAFGIVTGEGQSFREFIASIVQSVVDFATNALDSVTSFVEGFNDLLGGLGGSGNPFDKIGEQASGVGESFAVLTSAGERVLESLTFVFSSLRTLFDSVSTAIVTALRTAFDAIVTVVSQLDLTPIVGALQTFGAVAFELFITLANLSGTLITALAGVYDSISQLFESGGDFSALSDIAVTAFQSVIDIVGHAIGALSDVLSVINDLLSGAISPLDAFVALWEVQFSLIESITQTALDAALSVIETVVTSIGPIVQSGIEAAMQLAGVAWGEFSAVASEALTQSLGVISSALDDVQAIVIESLGQAAEFVGEAFSSVGSLIGEAMSNVGEIVASSLSESFSGASSSVGDALSGVSEAISSAFSSAIEAASAALAPIVEVTSAILQTMVSLWENVLSPIGSIISATLGAVGAIVGTVIGQIVETARAAFTPIVSVVGEVISSLSTTLFSGLSSLAGVVSGALTPVLTAFQSALSGLLNVVTTVMSSVSSAFTSALTALSGVVSSALSSVLSSFQTTLNGLLSIVTTVMSAVRAAFTSALTALGGVTTTALGVVRGAFTSVLSTLGGIASGALNTVRVAFTSAFSTISQTVTSGVNRVQTTLSTLRTIFNNVGVILRSFEASWQTTLNNVVRIVTTSLTNVVNTILTSMTSARAAITTALNAISTTFTAVTSAISTTVTLAFNSVRETVASTMNSVSSTISSLLQSISSAFSSAFDEVRSTVSAALLSVQSTVSSTMNSVLSAVISGVNSVVSAFASGFNSLSGIVSSAMSSVSSAISGGLSSALSSARGLVGQFTTIGIQIAQGMASGIRQAASQIAQEAIAAVQNALNSAAQALGIASPSKVSEEQIGEPIGDGITVGTVNALDTLAGDVTQAIDGAFDSIGDGLPDITANVGFSDITDVPLATTVSTTQRIEITVSISSDDTLAEQLSDTLTDLLGVDISLSDSLGLIG